MITSAPDFPGAGGTAALSLEASARVIGAYRWLERRLFEVLGGWTADEPVPEACLFYDVQSRQHAWHADLWGERLPVLDRFDPEAVTAAPSTEADQVLAALAGDTAGGVEPARGTLQRLVGLSRVVLPRLVVGYDIHLAVAAPVADAPVIRALQLVLADEIAAWRQAEALVERLVRRPHDLAVVTEHQQALESLVAGSPGFVSWAPTRGDEDDPVSSYPASSAGPSESSAGQSVSAAGPMGTSAGTDDVPTAPPGAVHHAPSPPGADEATPPAGTPVASGS